MEFRGGEFADVSLYYVISLEFIMLYVCPVCGYPDLNRDPKSLACFEICPCCGFQFNVTDDDEGYTFEQWRAKWIAGGMVWSEDYLSPPANWDPVKQLGNVK